MDSGELAELYTPLAPRVRGLCLHLLRSRADAEDAAQDVFLKAQAGFASYDRQRPFASWLLGIASHHCIDLLRRRTREKRLFEPEHAEEESAMSPSPSPLGEVLVREQRDHLRAAVAELPDRYRVPLALRYYAEMSYDEIASELGISHGQVATLLFRSKKQLRARVQA